MCGLLDKKCLQQLLQTFFYALLYTLNKPLNNLK